MARQTLPYARSPGLPLFERPPVTEVSMGVQLQGVRLKAVDLGVLHARFAEWYPIVEEHRPPPLQIEQFRRKSPSGIQFQFNLLDRLPMPLLVFLAEDRSSLVQIDENRFFCAWRRAEEEIRYPRYERFREDFVRNAEIFEQFTTDVGIDDMPTTQAEIGYVNQIPMAELGRPDVLANRLPVNADSHAGAGDYSTVSTSQHFTFTTQGGVDYARLHIVADPILADSESALQLSLIYRGEPHERFKQGPGLPAIMSFLDEGHDRIVEAFANNTTPEAQEIWRRVT